MYALKRHSSIVRQLLLNVPIRVIATTHDTSVAMIEKHYSRLHRRSQRTISRAARCLADEAPAGKVVAIAGR